MNRACTRKYRFKSGRDFIIFFGVVNFRSIFHKVIGAFFEQTVFLNHSRQGADSESPPAKSEQVDIIPRLVKFHQYAVCVQDILLQTLAGGLVAFCLKVQWTIFMIFPTARSDTRIVKRSLRCGLFSGHIRQDYIRVVFPVLVPGPITTNHDIFHFPISPLTTQFSATRADGDSF